MYNDLNDEKITGKTGQSEVRMENFTGAKQIVP